MLACKQTYHIVRLLCFAANRRRQCTAPISRISFGRFADIAITEGWEPNAASVMRTGDWVGVEPTRRAIKLLHRGVCNSQS